MPTILLLSTADTELLAARASGADYRVANPARIPPDAVAGLARGADLAVLRLLGGREAWPGGIEALRATGLPLIILGGEAAPDAGLMAQSTVAAGTVTEALGYLREGGPANLRELAAFLSDTVLLTGEGFAPPAAMPQHGAHPLPAAHRGRSPPRRAPPEPVAPQRSEPGPEPAAPATMPQDGAHPRPATHRQPAVPPGPEPEPELTPGPDGGAALRPVVAVVYYRAHELSGNTAFVDTLCAAISEQGGTPCRCSAVRCAARSRGCSTCWPGGRGRGDRTGRGRVERGRRGGTATWDVGALAALGVPVLQGLCLTASRAAWEARVRGAVADGRGHAGGDPGVRRTADHRAVLVQGSRARTASRCTSRILSARRALAGLAVRHARLRRYNRTRPSEWRSCCRRTRPSTHGSAMRSAWTRRQCRRAAAGDAGGRVHLGKELPEDGDEPDPHAHRGRRARRRVAHRGAAPAPPTSRIPVPSGLLRWRTGDRRRDLRGDWERRWGPLPGELYTDDRATSCWPR